MKVKLAPLPGSICFICFIVMACLNPVFAENSDSSVPEWLKRTDFSMKFETNQKSTLFLESVQPLYQDAYQQNVVFIQPRISMQEGDVTYNLGIGYRQLVTEDWIWGINMFGDYAQENSHGRIGLGWELIGQILEARINSYFGITPQRVVQVGAASTTYERVANGLDYELGSAVPYLPWLKIFASGFVYDFNNSTDRRGWKVRTEAKINDHLRLEFYTFDDNKGDREYGGRLRYSLAFHHFSDIFNGFKRIDVPFKEKDLRDRMLDPVERHHEIVVERFIQSGGLTIEAGRS